ncbi:MAG: uncharacterized protein JWM58_4062 [Rhizobium sp.]|nr:uncharacterized protein [Rhizobium sp.]
MTKLMLHIGIHRTGTTGLQRNLANNRDRLSAMGIAYPFQTNNHQDIAWGLHRGDLTGSALCERLQPFNASKQIILSGEDFCIHKSLGWLEPLKQVYDVEATIYLRRQDHWLMSWYNQHIKWPFSRRHSTMTPQAFMDCLPEFHWIDFDNTVQLWENAVGANKLTVGVVEKGQIGDAVADFLKLMGIGPADIEHDNSTHNDSLPTETLEFARNANLMDMKQGRRLATVNFLREVGRSSAHTGKTLFTAEQRQGILQRFAASNEALARRRFGREQLFLEHAPDDRDLYVEGTLAANSSYEELMMKTLAYLGRER